MSNIKTYTTPDPSRPADNQVGRDASDHTTAEGAGASLPVKPDESSRSGSDPADLATKMLTGGEDLRDHDFPVPQDTGKGSDRPVAEQTGKLDQYQIRSGGAPGEKPGDVQRGADVPTIMDQELSEPSALPDR